MHFMCSVVAVEMSHVITIYQILVGPWIQAGHRIQVWLDCTNRKKDLR